MMFRASANSGTNVKLTKLIDLSVSPGLTLIASN